MSFGARPTACIHSIVKPYCEMRKPAIYGPPLVSKPFLFEKRGGRSSEATLYARDSSMPRARSESAPNELDVISVGTRPGRARTNNAGQLGSLTGLVPASHWSLPFVDRGTLSCEDENATDLRSVTRTRIPPDLSQGWSQCGIRDLCATSCGPTHRDVHLGKAAGCGRMHTRDDLSHTPP